MTQWRRSTKCDLLLKGVRMLTGFYQPAEEWEHGGVTLRFTAEEMHAFIAGAKAGEFDLPEVTR